MSEAKAIINELLVDIFNRILTIEGEALKKAGIKLSMSEVHVLEAIQKASEPTMSLIAKNLGITIGSLSVAINTLYQKGYVRRYNDEADRRKVLIALEAKAFEVLKMHDFFHEKMIFEAFRDLGIEEDQILINSLKRIADYFKSFSL